MQRIWRSKGLWLRILFCWALGSSLPLFDEPDNYDLRFKLRGPQPVSPQVVIVYFDQSDWNAWNGPSHSWMRALKEFTVPSDSFFWRASTWDLLLGKILAQNPRVVGISFFFSQQLSAPDDKFTNLVDQRVIWSGQLDSEGRPVFPLMASSSGYNVALTDLREDEDRVLRRFSTPMAALPHMAFRLAESLIGSSLGEVNSYLGESKLINFRGGHEVFPSVSALDIFQGKIDPEFFRDKVVIVGSNSLPTHQYSTPEGVLSRAEVLAQVVDNIVNHRWPKRISLWLCSLYILATLLVATFIMLSYPQTLAVVMLIWLGLGVSAFSLWVFDSFAIWFPALSPLLTGMIAYMVLIGYQLTLRENQTWRLQKETEMLSELDQLRNNFVSLISHDLKTPIAKIQAICDRLLSGQISPEFKEGLTSVRSESGELHRYIQSILQISKLESNNMQLRKEATDLNEVVENVVNQLHTLAADKRQDLHLNLEPLFSLEMDSIMIREVILNLVENAIKYTPLDGRIDVETQEIDDRVVFSVRDTGPGIPPGDRQHIFEKFFRGQAGNTQIKGTGLGLFLAKYFIELHGGEVFLESDMGKGTRVGFTLPLHV